MKHQSRRLRFGAFALLGPLFACGQVLGQDPAKVAPKNVKVVFENDRLRVLEVRMKPGEKLPLHSHPAHLTLTLSDFKGKFLGADGEARLADGQASAWSWTEPITHASENVGNTEIRAFAIELKDRPSKTSKSSNAVDPVKKK